MPSTTLRAARAADAPAIAAMIHELAAFEQLSHEVTITPEQLARDLFAPASHIACVVAESAAGLVGYALFFRTYSTFLGKAGLWLEDLYVQPAARGLGLGKRLLAAVAAEAAARGYGRFEWSVLDWNARAIAFYEAQGARVLPDWRICRVTGEALGALAAR